MSRLIDAEPLIEFLEQKRKEWFDLDIGASCAYDIAKQTVEEASTVEAIPIEWLKQFIYTKPDVIEHLIVLWRREKEQDNEG